MGETAVCIKLSLCGLGQDGLPSVGFEQEIQSLAYPWEYFGREVETLF